MATTSTYLNFNGTTEAAFTLYRRVFGGEFTGGLQRFGDLPPQPDAPPLDPDVRRRVLHVELPLLGGHVLHGSDIVEQFGHRLHVGNHAYIHLETDTRAEARRLFDALSADGAVESPLAEMFWGAYWGVCKDPFGVQWMVSTRAPEA